jgi:hypothetical protein
MSEEVDSRGGGIVDFTRDIVWLRERLLTVRMMRDQQRKAFVLSRPFLKILWRLSGRLVGDDKDEVFQGGSFRQRERDGSWGPAIGPIDGPKLPRNPLCVLDPLEHARSVTRFPSGDELVQGIHTVAYKVELTETELHPQVWERIHDQAKKPSSQDQQVLSVLVWVDKDCRLRRVGFESNRGYGVPMWSITEFSDFGVPVPQEVLK